MRMSVAKWLPLERTFSPSIHEWISGFYDLHKKNPSLMIMLWWWSSVFVTELVPALGFLCQYAGSFSRIQWLRSLLCVVTVDVCCWYRQMWELRLLNLSPQWDDLFVQYVPSHTWQGMLYKLGVDRPESPLMGCLPLRCVDSVLVMWLKVFWAEGKKATAVGYLLLTWLGGIGCKHSGSFVL